jgi:hypothetical protein
MGANATTFVPKYTSGEVLTAANLSVTNSGIPVFADTTARDNSFGGTGEKVLAEGQFAYIEATNLTQYYDGAAWQNVGVSGLTYITQATPSAANSVSINNCFSSTYENYLITVNITATVGTNSALKMRLRASGTDATTNYKQIRINAYGSSIAVLTDPDGTDEWSMAFTNQATASSQAYSAQIFSPFQSTPTRHLANAGAPENDATLNMYQFYGFHSTASAYDGFTVTTAGTSFTGTIRVYGYQNS